jgi:hypothetical protein
MNRVFSATIEVRDRKINSLMQEDHVRHAVVAERGHDAKQRAMCWAVVVLAQGMGDARTQLGCSTISQPDLLGHELGVMLTRVHDVRRYVLGVASVRLTAVAVDLGRPALSGSTCTFSSRLACRSAARVIPIVAQVAITSASSIGPIDSRRSSTLEASDRPRSRRGSGWGCSSRMSLVKPGSVLMSQFLFDLRCRISVNNQPATNAAAAPMNISTRWVLLTSPRAPTGRPVLRPRPRCRPSPWRSAT